MHLIKSLKVSLKLFAKTIIRPCDIFNFLKCYWLYQRNASPNWKIHFSSIKTYLNCRHESAAFPSGHYFLQDIWASSLVHILNPKTHVDIGSRVDGFVAQLIPFCKDIEYIDIRKLQADLPSLRFTQADVTKLPHENNSIQSLSSLHVIEHIGLGRYGDKVDPDGWRLALKNLQRVLAIGGQLLLAVPCGRRRVVFHAHRIFQPSDIVETLNELELQEFSYIKDDKARSWVKDARLDDVNEFEYACGLFRFTKL
jgi:predicted SAM-dependent methyltransferase